MHWQILTGTLHQNQRTIQVYQFDFQCVPRRLVWMDFFFCIEKYFLVHCTKTSVPVQQCTSPTYQCVLRRLVWINFFFLTKTLHQNQYWQVYHFYQQGISACSGGWCGWSGEWPAPIIPALFGLCVPRTRRHTHARTQRHAHTHTDLHSQTHTHTFAFTNT